MDFGGTLVDAPVTQTITVGDVGTLTLPSGFSLVADFGATLLIPGQTTTFVVQMDAFIEGTYAGVISIESNDADENPLEFGVSGTVSLKLPSAWVIDDGDAGYSASGG